MANIFAITTVAEDIKADAAGKASAIFTVTNNTNKPVRGIAKARALETTQQGWLEVVGETERDFGARGTQQFTVTFSRPVSAAPSGAPGATAAAAEKFPFRIDIVSAIDPDEDFSEGPTVRVEVQAAAPPPPPPRKFPWWIILVIAGVVLLGGGVGLFLVIQKSCAKPPVFTGTWKMKAPMENRFQFVGTLKFEQVEGQLTALIWKIGDSESGAPLARFNVQVADGIGNMEGPLDNRGTAVKLKCAINGDGQLLINYTLTSPGSGPIQMFQVLDRE